MAKTELTLVLPGLARIVDQQINASVIPQALSNILNKARFMRDPTGLHRLLFNHFSETPLTEPDLPVVSLNSPEQVAIKVDPCYVHADRDRLLLFADNLNLTEAESTTLIAEIQPLVDELGGHIQLLEADSWLLILDTLPDITFSALPEVNGKGVETFLPTGSDRGNWIRLWNEIQMQLYDCDVNLQRIADGKLPVNSVWFWGMGNYTAKQNEWISVRGNLPLLNQLTTQSATALNNDAGDLKAPLNTGKHLWVADEVDIEADWQQQLQNLNDTLFQPLWQQVRSAKISQLNLKIPEHGHYRLSPLSSWKFWS
ncbi:MAG: hypothetical protein OEY48_03900 [Gammaproteobacteria bacterium]|nr:hypothetical protein [Gammaproteobacteria bacterium]MDH5591970.1 hypothetical protein [Gammaproteobacteria bacterium]